MKKTGVMIVVTAKGDFGYSPYFERTIVREQMNEETSEKELVQYEIDEIEWQETLFDRPSPVWLSIPEREARAAKETPAAAASSAEPPASDKADLPAAEKSQKPKGAK